MPRRMQCQHILEAKSERCARLDLYEAQTLTLNPQICAARDERTVVQAEAKAVEDGADETKQTKDDVKLKPNRILEMRRIR